MGFPFYVFVITVPLLIVAIVMTIIVISQKYCVTEPEFDDLEGGKDEEETENIEEKGFDEKTESFRNSMMWNFFVMFFYEACLEISISLVIGRQYINEFDADPEGE
jgi:hypothetical protein